MYSELTDIKRPRGIFTYNTGCHLLGAPILFLNKIKHSIQGYTSPRPFPISEFQRAIKYDDKVVQNWMKYLHQYTGMNSEIKDRTILELGPGADLGIGIILLKKGAQKYNALDVNNLVKSVPDQFYQKLFSYLEDINDDNHGISIDFLRSQLQLTCMGNNDRLNYICNQDFDLSVFTGEEIDFVFSQAAFEHFDNVEQTVSQLSKIVKPGTILIAEVDLKTHTSWIRDLDPLNIYRYSDFIYNLFKFRGSPNRLRP
ncbi:MAG TPA: methyltransferase domain-containing protein, partial [Bacillota bacterium]|nr:methyltransferase domain-containing protein [Bacillota bacterium]